MNSKRRSRKVTVENDKIAVGDISSSEKRKLSVFERLGPGAPRKYDVPEKHSTVDTESATGICHKWQKYGTCQYGGKCRYQHGPRREHSPEEYHHHHGDKDSDSDSELNGKSTSRDSKKDKIKSTVVVTKPNTQEESESDPGPDCTDEDLQRRLSQLKQELSRLDQEEKERERIERAGLAQISSDESEKDIPPVITPPAKHKKEKGVGEQSKKKKEKKKKKKKLQKLLPDAEEEKVDKKTHHVPLEKETLKAKQKALEKPKLTEKPKLIEKKKAGPMIPRSVQQKVVKPRQSSSSPSKSSSRSPSAVRKKRSSPKQMKRDKMPTVEKHIDDVIKMDVIGHGEHGLREAQHHTYSPSYRSDSKKDKAGEKTSRAHRELSPRVEIRDRSGERMARSRREVSPRIEGKDKVVGRNSRSRRELSPTSVARHRDLERESSRSAGVRQRGRSTTPQSRHSQSDGHWSRRATSRRTSSSSSSSSSDSSSSSSPSPVRSSRRSRSPRHQYASPHRRSPGKRTDVCSQSLSRHGKNPAGYGKGSRKVKDIERSPSKRRDTMERILHSRDRSVPVDVSKKHQLTELELRKIDDLSRRRDSSPRDSHWGESSVDKLRRQRSSEDERKQAIISESRHDQVDTMERSDRRKLEPSQSSRQRSTREVIDKRLHSTKSHDEYITEYDTRTHSPHSSTRALTPTDRHRVDYAQYREGYASATSERDRYADRDRYEVYARDTHDAYGRSEDRNREVDRERDYVSSTVIDSRDRDRYDRESSYSHSHYSSYVRETDRIDVRRDYSAYYDDRGRLIEDTSRLRTEDIRGRSSDDRSRDDYSRTYDRYRYLYDYDTSTRSDLDRRRESSRDVSSDRGRNRDWQLDRARWDRDRLRDDPRLLDSEIARSVHDPRDLIDPRDLVRDHTRDSRDVRVDSRSDSHSDLRIKVHSDVRSDLRSESRVDVRSDSRVDVRGETRVDVRSESHVDVRTDNRLDVRVDPRADVRDVHISSRSRDRSTDNRDSRGRSDRDRLVDVEHKDPSHDHLSRRTEWEQTARSWTSDKSKDRLVSGSRKRGRGEVEVGVKSPSSKHRREASPEKDYQKLDSTIKRSVEPDLRKPSSSRSKVSERHTPDTHLEQKPSQERKPKDPDILYPEKPHAEKDYDRELERREKKYDKTHQKRSKETTEGEKVEHDSRSTSSRDADSKESWDPRSKERDSHVADVEQDRAYEIPSWTSNEREADLDLERQNRVKPRKSYDKERDKVDKVVIMSADNDKLDESGVTSSVVSSSHHVDYKRRRSHSVDSPRKRPRKKVHEGEAVSDWSNPEKDVTDTDLPYKHSTDQPLPQVIDERFCHSPSRSSLGSKHSVPEDDRVEHRDDRHEDRRDDRLLYDYDRENRARDDLLDQDRSSRSDSRYLYADREREVSRTRSVDRNITGHYSDRRDDREGRDDYIREVDVRKTDPRQTDAYARDWQNADRIDEVDHRSRDRDRGLDRILDHIDHERTADVSRDRSVERMDWSNVYRDRRTENYTESCHSYRSDRVYPDTRVDSYTRESDRLVSERRTTNDVDPVLDRRDSPMEHPDTHVDVKSVEHGYYDNQDSKRDRYAETWTAPYPSTTVSTPRSQTDPTLVTIPPGDTPVVQPTDEKLDNEAIEFDDISDDDLDDIIGPDQSSEGEEQKPQKTGIIDVLDIDWSSLMKQNVPKSVMSGSALKRFTPATLFKKIGVSLQFAGEKLYKKIENICENQSDGIETKQAAEAESDQVREVVKKEVSSQSIKIEADTATEKLDDDGLDDLKLDVKKADVTQSDVIAQTIIIKPDTKSEEFNPDETKLDQTKPDVTKPDAVKPEASKLDALKPDVTKPVESHPVEAKPDLTKPDVAKSSLTKADAAKFKLLHSVAQFHVSLTAKRREREELLKDVGPYRRALCARRDLFMRKKLCKLDLDCDSLHLYPAQIVDHELYRQSVQIFRAERPQSVTANLNIKHTTEQEIAAS